ncbi:MAG: hypothetical protein HY077_14055 [Elusimicrobia bacterium]|nr:hypothetical protein [Elusimicrobiota bacterium]
MNSAKRISLSLLAVAAFAASAFANEGVSLEVSKIKDLKLRIYGFVETDFITDTTAGFNEEQGNNLVPMHNTATTAGNLLPTAVHNFAGEHARSQMSVRNSRLGFELTLPKTEQGLASQAIIELDFLGNNAPNTQPGTAPGTQSERDFFNNPALRVRHAYVNLTYKDQFNAKVGQYWSLLGWQPYYFPGETVVLASPGLLYRRFAQARVMHTLTVSDWTLESAADIAKPAQMNSASPEYHGGLRLASTKYKAASIGGAGTSMVGLSAAVSGALIPIQTVGIGDPVGQAYAFDVAIPIIASKDGKDRSNTLIAMGEIAGGNGTGGLEYSGLTLGVPGIATKTNLANTGTPVIDTGIAGFNLAGSAELIRYRTWRYHLQYSLPGGRWALSSGYAQVEGRNLDRFGASGTIGTNGNTVAAWSALAPKIQFGYASVFYDAASWLRFAGEYNHTRVTYNDPNNRFATNNRYQFTTLFIF